MPVVLSRAQMLHVSGCCQAPSSPNPKEHFLAGSRLRDCPPPDLGICDPKGLLHPSAHKKLLDLGCFYFCLVSSARPVDAIIYSESILSGACVNPAFSEVEVPSWCLHRCYFH